MISTGGGGKECSAVCHDCVYDPGTHKSTLATLLQRPFSAPACTGCCGNGSPLQRAAGRGRDQEHRRRASFVGCGRRAAERAKLRSRRDTLLLPLQPSSKGGRASGTSARQIASGQRWPGCRTPSSCWTLRRARAHDRGTRWRCWARANSRKPGNMLSKAKLAGNRRRASIAIAAGPPGRFRHRSGPSRLAGAARWMAVARPGWPLNDRRPFIWPPSSSPTWSAIRGSWART